VIFAGHTIVGAAFTITVAVIGVPTQPLAVGVIVNVTVCCTNVVLVSEPLILPVPLAAIPVTLAVLFLVHAYVVPLTALLNAMVVIGPLQIVCVDGVATAFGIGFTVIGTFTTGPVHPLAEGVMLNVTTTGALVVLVNVPVIGFVVPLAAIPVTVAVLFLVQLNVVPATGPDKLIGAIAEPEQIVCGLSVDPQPAILLTVVVPIVVQLAVLSVPLIHPEATATPLHLTSQSTELSLNAPCASIKKENGALLAGTSAENCGGGF
jgi:hypothetical protein